MVSSARTAKEKAEEEEEEREKEGFFPFLFLGAGERAGELGSGGGGVEGRERIQLTFLVELETTWIGGRGGRMGGGLSSPLAA